MFQYITTEVISIILLTLRMTIMSTIISSIIGIPLGFFLQQKNFALKNLIIIINRTFMAAPPVVIGLVVYLLLMRNGPLGIFGLLFSFWAMVIAQVIIITPIICGMVYTASLSRAPIILSFAYTMGASKKQSMLLLLKELKNDIYFVIITGFGRAMSEVGAIMIVGGNIRNHTRTMTTAISLMRGMGDINEAITLGVILMLIVFSIQIFANLIRKKGGSISDLT